jgi:hypothetical protein
MSAPDRVALIRASTTLTGLDFVQVSLDQLQLFVFIHHLATDMVPALAATLATIAPGDVTIHATSQVAPAIVPVTLHTSPLLAVNGRLALRFTVAMPGGFGHYKLRIAHAAIDPYFNDIAFSFKANCPSDLDCKAGEPDCAPDERVDYPVDYRARDFWSFRQALIDFAAARYPDWQDRVEADFGMVPLEMLSALGDEFSYASDRIVRERVLDDATQRRSLRHLAALVDYPVDAGSGAFAWLAFTVNANGVLAAGTAFCDARAQIVYELGRGLVDDGKAFALTTSRNAWLPYGWDEDATCLPLGATTLTLAGHHQLALVPDPAIDPVGRWVLLWSNPSDPDKPERRLAVRVIRARDTTDPLTTATITEIEWDAPTPFEIDLDALVVRANIIPATSGLTRTDSFQIGPTLAGAPVLPRALERVGANHDLTDRLDDATDPDEADDALSRDRRVKFLYSLPGSAQTPLVWLPHENIGMRPEVRVTLRGSSEWAWMLKLIGDEVASVTDEVFTLEEGSYREVFGVDRVGGRYTFADYASDEGYTIRFGDREFGRAPADGMIFDVRFRLGGMRRADVAADTLTRFRTEFDDPPVRPAFVDDVTNPLAAYGGRDPETVERIRTNAPQAFRQRPLRAVRAEDYAEIAERLPWVQRAGATLRWTGSWATMFVTPDPRGEVGLSAAHRRELEATMDRVRQAGRDVKILAPRYADIDLEIRVCVAPNAYPGEVEARVLAALFSPRDPQGFFHPDHFTFGTPLSRAALMAAIQDIGGVKAVEAMRIRRRGRFDWRAFDEFSLSVGPDELIRVANDALLPERGAVRLIMEGGA